MKAAVAGIGHFVPKYSYDNAFMWRFVGQPKPWHVEPGKDDRIEKLLGIRERRFAVPLSQNEGVAAAEVDEIDMAVAAATQAIERSHREPEEIDLLIHVSCTVQKGARRHFMLATQDLHRRLGLDGQARVECLDAGCGGLVHGLESAWEAILSRRRKAVLVVASNCTSQYMDRELYTRTGAWLSPILFGDGACAIVLVRSDNGAGIIDAVTFVDPNQPLMSLAGDPDKDPELAYAIDAQAVRRAFGTYARNALERLRVLVPEITSADSIIFHQVNRRVLDAFVSSVDWIDPARVPINVDTRGNIAAAATGDILAAEIEADRLGKGSLVVICAVGAGTQSGAIALRL